MQAEIYSDDGETMARDNSVQYHLEALRKANVTGNALRLALYLYEITILSGKRKSKPLIKYELATVLQCSESSIKDSARKLREAGFLYLTEAELRADAVEYRLLLPNPPLCKISRKALPRRKFVRKLNMGARGQNSVR